jgi:uncharacterized repeat protein (TIGR03803 family)
LIDFSNNHENAATMISLSHWCLAVAGITCLLAPAQSQDQAPAEPNLCIDPLYHFGTRPNDPIWPLAIGSIAVGPNGNLYTTSTSGGTGNRGTIYTVSPGGDLKVLFEFDGPKYGVSPWGGLSDGHDGYFYGTAYGGGRFGAGTVFRLAYGNSTPEVLYHFRNGSPAGIAPDPCPTSPNCPYSPRQRADFSPSYPITPPIMGSDGNLYGVTWYSNNQQFGALYRLSPSGGDKAFHVVCIFQPNLVGDMKQFICTPTTYGGGVLIRGREPGTFYGTTTGGHGSVFKFSGGSVTTLHEFKYTDGSTPLDLLQGTDGALYGTTYGGGTVNWGVAYRVDPSSLAFGVIHDFNGSLPPGGGTPQAGLALGSDGFLYGVTRTFGEHGRGAVYRLKPDGSLFQKVDSFNFANGRIATTTPAFANGVLYGSTYQGGRFDRGVFYRLKKAGRDWQPVITVEGTKVMSNDWVTVNTGVAIQQLGAPCTTTPWTMKNCDGNKLTVEPTLPCPDTKTDGISIRVSCASEKRHVVQFIAREYQRLDQTFESGVYGTAPYFPDKSDPSVLDQSCQAKTTDPKNPAWRTDSPDSLHEGGSPYYESSNSYRTDCDSLTAFDSPSAQFDAKYSLVRILGTSFAICDSKIAVIEWQREYNASSTTNNSTPPIRVTALRAPNPGEVARFQAISTKQGFSPWP